ncbi:hypothetical protein BD770DRAFT_392996 [Pilaira anomala]|nr:hypothetical protein BD770DRAFT_392996 [Pilaira anomala]
MTVYIFEYQFKQKDFKTKLYLLKILYFMYIHVRFFFFFISNRTSQYLALVIQMSL